MVGGIQKSTSIIVYFPQLLHLIATFSTVCFRSSFIWFHQHLILNIVKFSTMTVIYFNHFISCLQWTPLYQEKLTNWEFPPCFLVSILFYQYDPFYSYLMVTFYLCTDFFISSSIKILYPLFNQRKMLNIFHDRNKALKKEIIYLLLFSHIKVLVVCHMYIFLNMQLSDGVCYGGNCFFFYHYIICFQLVNQINSQFHIFWNKT